jgi:hypothetical protein
VAAVRKATGIRHVVMTWTEIDSDQEQTVQGVRGSC